VLCDKWMRALLLVRRERVPTENVGTQSSVRSALKRRMPNPTRTVVRVRVTWSPRTYVIVRDANARLQPTTAATAGYGVMETVAQFGTNAFNGTAWASYNSWLALAVAAVVLFLSAAWMVFKRVSDETPSSTHPADLTSLYNPIVNSVHVEQYYTTFMARLHFC